MFRRFRALSLSLVAALGLTLVVASPATADPVVLLQHDDANLSITVTRDAEQLTFDLANVGTEVEQIGLAAYLTGGSEIDLLWQDGPFKDQFQVDLAPGETQSLSAPFWPGTQAVIYRERDTTPEPVAAFETPGDWVQLVMGGTEEEPDIRVGAEFSWSEDTVVPGESLLVSVEEAAMIGPVDVMISSDSALEFVGDQLVMVPGASARSIGTAYASAVVVGAGYRVGFTTVAEIPSDLPPGEYSFFLNPSAGPMAHYSKETLTVVSGAAASATAGSVAITGRARLHDTLTAVTTGWDPAATLVYQWYADGQPVERGIEPTLVLDYYENSTNVTVEVSAWRAGYTRAAALSAPTAEVSHLFFTSVSPPTITGDFVVGQKLTVVAPVWTPTTGFIYEWFVDYQPTGITTRTFTLRPDDLGKSVGVYAHATKLGYHDTGHFSLWSAPVEAGTLTPPANVERPKITGNAQVGKTLTLRTGGWKPSPGYGFQWSIDNVPVPGATEQTFTVPGEFEGVTTVGKSVSAQLTVTSPGYQEVVVELAAAEAIAIGQFSKGAPWFSPTQPLTVGLTLTAQPGAWYPVGEYSYEWTIGGVVRGTGETFVVPADAVGKRIKITTFATAVGYEPAQRSWLSDTTVLP